MRSKFTSSDEPLAPPPITLAAPDDLEFINKPYLFDPNKVAIFLRNRNATKGIIASVSVTSDLALTVETMNRLTHKERWPIEFEVRLPPGSDCLLGLPRLKIWKELREGLPPVEEWAEQIYKLQGAYYRDPPLLAPQENPLEWLWVYSVPMSGFEYYRWSDVMLNLHPNRVIEAKAIVRPSSLTDRQIKFSVSPGWATQVSTEAQPQTYEIRKIDFI